MEKSPRITDLASLIEKEKKSEITKLSMLELKKGIENGKVKRVFDLYPDALKEIFLHHTGCELQLSQVPNDYHSYYVELK